MWRVKQVILAVLHWHRHAHIIVFLTCLRNLRLLVVVVAISQCLLLLSTATRHRCGKPQLLLDVLLDLLVYGLGLLCLFEAVSLVEGELTRLLATTHMIISWRILRQYVHGLCLRYVEVITWDHRQVAWLPTDVDMLLWRLLLLLAILRVRWVTDLLNFVVGPLLLIQFHSWVPLAIFVTLACVIAYIIWFGAGCELLLLALFIAFLSSCALIDLEGLSLSLRLYGHWCPSKCSYARV